MKKCLWGYAIFGAALLCSIVSFAQEQRQIPSVEIKNFNGKSMDAAAINNDGKPMILFVWELTCKPCITEFNAIAPVYTEWKEETGVKIVAISVDDTRSSSKVQPLVRSKGWDFEVYLDPNQAFKRAMNVTYCPYVFVLNEKGQVVWQKGGYSPGDEDIIIDVVRKVAKGEKVE